MTLLQRRPPRSSEPDATGDVPSPVIALMGTLALTLATVCAALMVTPSTTVPMGPSPDGSHSVMRTFGD